MEQQAGSSSITSQRNYLYDVFLSFYGEDTRLRFVCFLREFLRQRGIHVFLDDDEIRTGEEITPALFNAIENSRIAIIVFSENYANSTFCLRELEKILECFKEEGRLIYPVFYYVDPSELRRPTGSYAKALARLDERFKDNKEIVDKWRLALSQAAELKGCHLQPNSAPARASKLEIPRCILLSLSAFAKHAFTSLLDLSSTENVKMIGIWRAGGIGKSTIARAVYNSIANRFEGICFLSKVRDISNKNGLPYLQEILLSELAQVKDLKLGDYKGMIKRRLQQKKILLVLDDVDQLEQLEELAGKCDWFGRGSRIIITTRDRQLLVSHGIKRSRAYNVKELNDGEALQLLSWRAFRKDTVNSNYSDVLNRAICNI